MNLLSMKLVQSCVLVKRSLDRKITGKMCSRGVLTYKLMYEALIIILSKTIKAGNEDLITNSVSITRDYISKDDIGVISTVCSLYFKCYDREKN